MALMIVDTSALIAFFIQSEKHHLAARHYIEQNPAARWVITETVFDEFVTWMRAKVSIASSIQVGQILRTEHIYVNISDEDDATTWETFSKYNDKKWSYTDCSTLVIANKLEISRVFAFDEHINQMAGFGIECVP